MPFLRAAIPRLLAAAPARRGGGLHRSGLIPEDIACCKCPFQPFLGSRALQGFSKAEIGCLALPCRWFHASSIVRLGRTTGHTGGVPPSDIIQATTRTGNASQYRGEILRFTGGAALLKSGSNHLNDVHDTSTPVRLASWVVLTGVSWISQSGTWRACISIGQSKVLLGTFPTEEEAARAYDR